MSEITGIRARARGGVPARSPDPAVYPGNEVGDDVDGFTVVGAHSFDDESNTMAHAMAWHGGALYVGSTAPSNSGTDARGRIYRHDPADLTWEMVYESPLRRATARAKVPDVQRNGPAGGGDGRRAATGADDEIALHYGFRSLIAHQGPTDAAPCLYATTMSRWGGMVMRSEDGRGWTEVAEPGFGDDTVLSFRSMTPFRGRVFVAPVGTITDEGMDRNLAPRAEVFVTDDPASGSWDLACPEGFGDPANRAVFSLAATDTHLYAGTANPTLGFQVWRTTAEGAPPFAWERVLTDGAVRFATNYAALHMAAHAGALYVGGGIPGFGYDKVHDIGPTACELVRINVDGSWDLIFGEPRFSPQGLKVPLSGRGPGLDNFFNSVVWAMGVHKGRLHIGTHNWEPFDRVQSADSPGLGGGWELWSSADGEDWTCLIADGGGNPCDTGIRTLCSSPEGLYVGTCNHTKLLRVLGRRTEHREALTHVPKGFRILRGE